MSNLSCEVIKDLLPSYVDGICSKESQKLIEVHISECKDCGDLLDRMNSIEIAADKSKEKEIDYMKKLKRHIDNKLFLSLGLLIGFIVIGLLIIVSKYGDVPIILYYLISPVLIFASHFMLSDRATQVFKTKWKIGISSLGLILICYSILLEFLTINWVNHGVYPFGISVDKIGPFIFYQHLVIATIQIVIFICTILVSVKTTNSYSLLLNIYITGSCLSLAFITMLKSATSMESFIKLRNHSILVLLIECVVMTTIIFILDRRKIDL